MEKSVLLKDSVNENDLGDQQEEAVNPTPVNIDRFPAVIEIIQGSMVFDADDSRHSTSGTDTLQPLGFYAKEANLDIKQHVAFQINCSTFMLS